VQVYLDDIPPTAVVVELYAEPRDPGGSGERIPMSRERGLPGVVQGYLYSATVLTDRPPAHYTPRVVPFQEEVAVPLEAPWVLWQR